MSLVQVSSIAMMYVSMEGCLGVMTKLGPLARSEDCARVSGLDDKLMTHLLMEPVDVSGLLLLVVDVVVVTVVVLVVVGLVVVVVVVVYPAVVVVLCLW